MDSALLDTYLQRFRDKHLLVIGDVMLDRFIWGSVSRISPEAPVPVVDVTREEFYPGGAANVARNLTPFAARVSVMGRAGKDSEGDHLLRILAERDLNSDGVLRSALPTTVKTRVVARSQQVVRIDRETRAPLLAAERAAALDFLDTHLNDIDAIILQDYGKGFLDQAFVDALAEINSGRGIPVTVDPSPANPLVWKGANTIKPNRQEAFKDAGIPESPLGPDPSTDPIVATLALALFEKWDTRHLLITLSELGMVLVERDRPPIHIPSRAREVFDVSGAGDTAIALYTLALASGASPREAAEISNYASAVVVGKTGTATLSADELRDALKSENG